jgi:hypothetical protein
MRWTLAFFARTLPKGHPWAGEPPVFLIRSKPDDGGCSNLAETPGGPMACAVCRKSLAEHETFTLLEGVPYHNECFDRYLSAQEQGRAGEPPPEK